MKNFFYSSVLLAIASVWAMVGYTYAVDSAQPIYLEVPVPYEVMIVKEWDETLTLGLTPTGEIVELGGEFNEKLYLYVITVRMNVGPAMNETTVWVPFPGGLLAGVVISFQSDDYTLEVRAIDHSLDDLPMPEPYDPAPEDADEF